MPAFDATLRSAGTQTLTARDVANAVSGLQAGIVGNARVDSVGRLSAWGYNSSGELGDNSLLRSTEPVAVNTAGVLAGKTVTLASQSARGSMASGSIVMTAKPHGCLIERRLAWARRRFRKHFLAWFGGVT